jgi:hypothetical protein
MPGVSQYFKGTYGTCSLTGKKEALLFVPWVQWMMGLKGNLCFSGLKLQLVQNLQ